MPQARKWKCDSGVTVTRRRAGGRLRKETCRVPAAWTVLPLPSSSPSSAMNGHSYHSQPYPQRRQHDGVDQHHHPAASDSVQEAHQLLAAYPYGSATPSSHGQFYPLPNSIYAHGIPLEVARHLSNLSISAAPPSYVQPYAAVPSNTMYHQPRFPQYSEYAQEFTHITGSQQPAYGGSYWENTRNEAVYHLAGQGPLVLLG